MFTANVNAEPGPSGLRNNFVQTLACVQNGIHALQKWLAAWGKCKVSSYAQRLWGRVLLIPIQDGVRQRQAVQESTQAGQELPPLPTVGVDAKIRPIGLAESLLKVGEGAKHDPLIAEIRRHFEPNQLAVGTPDGVVVGLAVVGMGRRDN